MTDEYESISAETRKKAREILDIIDPDKLTTDQRLTQIENILKKKGLRTTSEGI